MKDVTNDSATANKRIVVLLLVLLTVILCWVGLLDHQAAGMVDGALVDAAVIFGSARLLNGFISVMQSIDFSVLMLTVSPFESLAPIHDLIERFSEVMTVALASLAMQKVMLMITSNNIFNVLITVSAGSAMVAMFCSRRWMARLLKVFCIMAFLRFALVLVVAANTAVDAIFLEDSIEANQQDISALQGELASLSAMVLANRELAEESVESQAGASLRAELATEQDRYSKQLALMQELSEQISEKQAEIDAMLAEYSVFERANPFAETPPKLVQAREELDGLEAKLDVAGDEAEVIDERIDSLNEKIECEVKRAGGGTCSISEWAKSSLGIDALSARVQSAIDSASDSVSSVIEMIALMILKSIVLPLLFAWIVYRFVRWMWYLPSEAFDLS